MPWYIYHCDACDSTFKTQHSMEYEPDACMVCGATKEKLFRKPTSSINIPSKNVQEKSNKKEVVQESLEKSKRELEELKKQFSEEYKP